MTPSNLTNFYLGPTNRFDRHLRLVRQVTSKRNSVKRFVKGSGVGRFASDRLATTNGIPKLKIITTKTVINASDAMS